MQAENKTVRYEFFEGFDATSNSALARLGRETTTAIIEQAEAGYLPTGLTGSNEIKAFQFSFFPEVEASTGIDELDLEIFSTDDFAEFEAEIEEQADLGNEIVIANFGDGQDGEGTWNAYLGEVDDPVVYFSSDDPEDFLDLLGDAETDERNLGLLDIEYGDGNWFATFADFEDLEADELDATALSSSGTFDRLTGRIDDRLDRGDISLVDLEYGDGAWFARYYSDADLEDPLESSYFSSASYATFQTEIEEQEDEGFDLVDVEYVRGVWYGVFNESLPDTDSESAFIADNDLDLEAI